MTQAKTTILLLSSGALAITAGCASGARSESRAYVARPVEQLYNSAAVQLDRRSYDEAIGLFNEVERQHPYSEWARRASVMAAFAAYRARRYDEAITTAQRYVSLHPGSEGAPYAYYIIALSHFDQIIDVGRDQRTTELAKGALLDIVKRYPDSDYAQDARLKLDMVNDQLAGKEMTIGRWYLRRNQHLPAINRFRTVVGEYQTTSHAPEALHRLVEAYLSVGLTGQAKAAAAVLGHNHADTIWYERTYDLMDRNDLIDAS
ncbi:MAG: outer membrane protein assembly factor BamD [Pseudomonadota bacterium]